MVYNKAYDNALVTGSIIGGIANSGDAHPMMVVAGVIDKERVVDIAHNGFTIRLTTDDAKDLAAALLRAVQEVEVLPDARKGGPIFVDEEGKLYE